MDEIKNMIERYKKELLEYSKAAPSRGQPEVIGYVSEEARAELNSIFPEQPQDCGESAELREKIFEELCENSAENIEKIVEAVSEEKCEKSAENDKKPAAAENPAEAVLEENCEKNDKNDENDEIFSGAHFEKIEKICKKYEENRENNSEAPEAPGSGTQPETAPEPVYESVEQFFSENAFKGTLMFRVFAAQGALPVEGARCVIFKKIGGGEHIFFTLMTDESGNTAAGTLPAPDPALSLDENNRVQTFSQYDARISKDGYADAELRDIPVFGGVSSVQQVTMLPAELDEK